MGTKPRAGKFRPRRHWQAPLLSPQKPPLLAWLLAGLGPGPGEPSKKWIDKHVSPETPKRAVKCDMCSGIEGGPACVRACPTGAAIRVAPEEFLTVARLEREG